jgi:hypothetical protein
VSQSLSSRPASTAIPRQRTVDRLAAGMIARQIGDGDQVVVDAQDRRVAPVMPGRQLVEKPQPVPITQVARTGSLPGWGGREERSFPR